MLTKTVPEKQRAPDHQARTAGGPDPESELDLSEAAAAVRPETAARPSRTR